jgi:gliding motility-associated-like protein
MLQFLYFRIATMKKPFYHIPYPRISILFLFILSCHYASATHIVGGEFSYQYLGDTTIGPGNTVSKYQVNLSIYEDCLNGNPIVIAEDNPAYLTIFQNDRTLSDPTLSDNNAGFDSISYSFSELVPTGFSNKCATNLPQTCVLKKTFIKTYYLPHNPYGYVVTYQRCCRNDEINNIQDPGSTGSTFYCTIPAWPLVNNSAVFNNYPPQIICLNNPLSYNNSAADADGDSLSYQFCTSLECCTSGGAGNSKPVPVAPDQLPPLYYDSVLYDPGYSSSDPLTGFPPIQIDPATGLITGTPNVEGRFLVTICCDEWRHGVLINTSKREFQFVVAPCSKTVVADIPQYSTDFNTYIIDCKNYTVHFVNTSTGGFAYYWNFGVPTSPGNTSDAFEPTFTYPDTGTFSVTLVVNPGTTCPDSIIRLVKIYPIFLTDFSDSGTLCPNDSISFKDMSLSSLKPINYWKWNFGDADSSYLQNPSHSFTNGGTYNVTLVSKNVKDCTDTALKQVLVETFKPFAGDDTIIVKGESLLFDATGGVQYSWYPPTYLSDTTVYDPTGYFPDTGTFNYIVHVQSEFGCYGNDTIKVQVVNQAEFFVPTAFTPNGDGKNDIFKPIAAGYKKINYFMVFNRWGERVYAGDSFEEGWDGTYNGQKADLDTYFWEISFVDRFGKDGLLKGDVTLIR